MPSLLHRITTPMERHMNTQIPTEPTTRPLQPVDLGDKPDRRAEFEAEFNAEPLECIEKMASDFVYNDDKNEKLLDDMSSGARKEFQDIVYETQSKWRQEALSECLADGGKNAVNVFGAYRDMWVKRQGGGS